MQSLLRFGFVPALLAFGVAGACSSTGGGDDDNVNDGGQAGMSGGNGGSDPTGAGRSGRPGQAGGSAKGGSAGSSANDAGAPGDSGTTGNDTGGSTGGTGHAGGADGNTDAAGAGAASGDAGSPSGAGGSNQGGAGGTGGASGTGGGAGAAGDSCGPIVIDGLSHHLGDGSDSEGTSLSRSFSVSCDCQHPWLSFQIDGPNREDPPRVYLNGAELASLASFYPAVSSADVWQSNGGSSYDYNGYLQIHYDVSGKLLSGSNTFDIANGTSADDYNFQDIRIECGAATTPPGPDIVNRGGWVGYFDDRTGDDPAGIQGAFYGYSDGTSCTLPSNVCASGACCIAGTTLATSPTTNWGCGMGLELHNSGGSAGTELAYSGPANCFELEFSGNSGGSDVRMQAPNYSDMTNRTAPVVSLGPITGPVTKQICFSDFACPADAEYPCAISGSWYKLEVNVVGGHSAGAFNVCLRSLIPFTL